MSFRVIRSMDNKYIGFIIPSIEVGETITFSDGFSFMVSSVFPGYRVGTMLVGSSSYNILVKVLPKY